IALLVSSMTGPGLVTIPILFQNAGWITSTIVFILITFLSGAASLFLCETLSSVVGNEKFQRQIEFSSLSNILISNPKKRIFIQVMLYISIQSVNIASILISAQSMDTLLVSLAGRTCGIGIHPRPGLFCVYEQSRWNSPFGDDYMLITAGYLMTLAMVLPLALMELVDNIKVQILSFGTLVLIIIGWLVTFCIHGLDTNFVPTIGNDQSQTIGTVLFNYAFVTTVPSWVNDLGSTVSIRKSVWYSATISTIAYIALGCIGGMAYKMDVTSNIIAAINASKERSIVSVTTTYLFPLTVLITSIPVYTIVVRYNLQRTGQCGKVTATFLSTILPWTVVIPFQTGYWLNSFTNWTSLIFTSISNFILPFYFYYLNEKRRSNTKVVDEVDDAFSIKTTGRDLNDSVCGSPVIRSPKSAKSAKSARSLPLPLSRNSPLSRSSSINSVRSIKSWLSMQVIIRSTSSNDHDGDDSVAMLSDVDNNVNEQDNDKEPDSPDTMIDDENCNNIPEINIIDEDKHLAPSSKPSQRTLSVPKTSLSAPTITLSAPTITRADYPTEQNNINEKSETKSFNNLSLAPPESEPINHRRSLSAPYSLITSSTTAISNSLEVTQQPFRPKLHLEIPPILTRRTSFSRRSSQDEYPPSPPLSSSPVIPIITVNNDDGIAVIVELNSNHNSSSIEISNSHDGKIVMNNQLDSSLKKFDEQAQHPQRKTFKAFPISTRNSVICAKICGAFSVFLVGGIIFYDFLQLAMGNNVF
ncbi:3761_t:CDS:2, partial [Ambispora leptoticha]